MNRLGFSALAGGIFGAGLLLSGMTDTTRVQGWLDVFGDWDPTLAFVLGGAILPMAVAWRVAARMYQPALGGTFPEPPKREVGPHLVIGSVLFGMGWALAGLCPGPALASLGFGGWGGLVFLLAMAAAMVFAPMVRKWIDNFTLPRSAMDIRALTPAYAVSPQIEISDLAALKAAGFTTIIDNRPDGEIPPHLHGAGVKAAAEALGLTFVINPVLPGALSAENVAVQKAAVEAASGPVFAYCASGNRSSILWMLMNAGKLPVDEMIATTARFGYNHAALRAQIEAAAAP
ncbi:hypothetical protein MASR2M74_09310 [Paracoccaceae bacterium]